MVIPAREMCGNILPFVQVKMNKVQRQWDLLADFFGCCVSKYPEYPFQNLSLCDIHKKTYKPHLSHSSFWCKATFLKCRSEMIKDLVLEKPAKLYITTKNKTSYQSEFHPIKMKIPPALKLRWAKAEREGFEPPDLLGQRFSRPPH